MVAIVPLEHWRRRSVGAWVKSLAIFRVRPTTPSGFSRRPASAPPPQLANSVQLPTPIRLGSSLDYSQSTLSNGDGEAVWVGVDTFWDSTTVPNDTYTLQSVAFDAAGNAAPSTGVTIVVNNPSPT